MIRHPLLFRQFALFALGLLLLAGYFFLKPRPLATQALEAAGDRAARVPAAPSVRRGDGKPRFREVGQEAGLRYRWKIPGKRPLNILQTIGNGCAFLDYDRDGNLDILLVGAKLALYRGDGKGTFTDVTQQTGLSALSAHFLGCAVGDYDNDGDDDLYISGFHTGILLRNEQGQRFQDVTRAAGLEPQPWGTSCGFADLDNDGFLDLYVANYAAFDPEFDMLLCPYKGILTSCGPHNYDAIPNVLYHNEKGARFRDVTEAWKAGGHGKGLGVAFADFDSSGRVSVAIANDLIEGDLLHNLGRNKMKNIGEISGTGLDEMGDTHAGMGIDWADFDNDGKFDLFVTTFSKETKCLYRNEGDSLFAILSDPAGIQQPTNPYVAWGCKFFDADNDGWLDLMIANGHVQDNVHRFEKASYRQPTQFLHSRGGTRPTFADATKSAALDKLPRIVGRGLTVGDYDNDGRVDALVVNSEGRPLLLHNETDAPQNNWIGFHLTGAARSNRSAYGAVITVQAGGQKRVRQCQPSGSYLSSSDARVHFGLGSAPLESVIVQWPDGSTQTLANLPTRRYLSLTQPAITAASH